MKKRGYKNTLALVITLALYALLGQTALVAMIVEGIPRLGLLGAFLGGAMYTSMFTIVPSAIVLVTLAESGMNLWVIAALGSVGAVLGDVLILSFLKDSLWNEWEPWYKRALRSLHVREKKSRLRNFALGAAGALIIASPLPDELGIALMGAGHVPRRAFLLIALLFNALGIAALIGVGEWFHAR